MHRIGQLPIMVVIALLAMVSTASAYSLVIDEINGNVTTSVTPITETFYKTGSATVVIYNNLNKSVDINIYSGQIVPSDSSFTVNPKSSYAVDYTFTTDFDGRFRYIISSEDFQKVVYQNVSVDIKGAGISFTKELNLTIEERSLKRVFVGFTNTGEAPLKVTIMAPSIGALVSVIPEVFNLEPGDTRIITYLVYGVEDTIQVPVTIEYGGEKETLTQMLRVKTTPIREVIEKEEILKDKEKTLREMISKLKKISLDGPVKIVMPNKGVVKKQVTVKVTFNNTPLDRGLALVEFDESSTVITISQGTGTFTPTVAGEYTVKLLNGYGDVVAIKSIKIERKRWNFTIPSQEAGQPFTVKLPEEAHFKIIKDGRIVFSGTGSDSYNITLTEIGKYRAEFVGDAYMGETTFKVTGTPSLTVMYGNKVVMPGSEITAGSSVKIAATVGGAPVNGKVRVLYPASAYGYSSGDIQNLMLQQMFMQMYLSYYGGKRPNLTSMPLGMTFVPPDKIMVELPAPNGVAVIPIPDKTDGYMVVSYLTQDGNVAAQYTFKVKPKTLLMGYEYYVISTLVIILALIVLGKRGVIKPPEGLRIRLGKFRSRLRKKAELPDLD